MKEKKYDKVKDAISIREFLSRYLGIESTCIKLRHCDLKEFRSPLVVGVSNDYADKNPDLVKEGFLILVLDCKNNRGTYVNPKFLKTLVASKGIRQKIEELEKIRSKTFEDFKVLFDKTNELTDELVGLGRFDSYESDLEELELMGKADALEELQEFEEKWNELVRIRRNEND
jgi:hypothetical protein